MIDLKTEDIFPWYEAPKHLPKGRRGGPVHPGTVLRWILKGIRGTKLEALRLGGHWVTSSEALQRFAERLTPNLETEPQTRRPPSARERATRRAEKNLKKIGI
jgi:hypothetical protein